MALTTPRGFSGGPMADIDYGVGAAGDAWVETAAALAVTAVNGTRSVSIAAGTACAYGIRVTNDAAISQALAAPSSGGAWYLLALRFNWSTRGATLQVLPGPTTGTTTAPNTIPPVLPATAVASPGTGTGHDLPLAWAFVQSADTTVTLFDVRMRTQLNEPIASTPQALIVLALQLAPITGMLIPSISDGVTYQWDGTTWQDAAGINGSFTKRLSPKDLATSGIGNAPSAICGFSLNGSSWLVDVRLSAPNYDQRYLLWVWDSPFDDTGRVQQISMLNIINTPNYSAPTWSVSSSTLFATISNAPANASSPIKAYSRSTQSGIPQI